MKSKKTLISMTVIFGLLAIILALIGEKVSGEIIDITAALLGILGFICFIGFIISLIVSSKND